MDKNRAVKFKTLISVVAIVIGLLWLGRIFYDWYGGDFEQAAGSVLSYAARYSPELRKALSGGRQPDIRWLDYDWRLNDRRNVD